MEKKAYEKLKDIRTRISKGEKTTFQERNILNIYDKKMNKLKSKKIYTNIPLNSVVESAPRTKVASFNRK